MSLGFTHMQAQDAPPAAWGVPGVPAPIVRAASTREIPYDHVARFELRGERGSRVKDVINVSTDGAFVAVSIGYGFIPKPLGYPPIPPAPETRERISVPIMVEQQLTGAGHATTTEPRTATVAAPALSKHSWVNAVLAHFRQVSPLTVPMIDWFVDVVRPDALLQRFLLRQHGFDFRYTIVDSGTGRELQNMPIHNIAGLGGADGQRPFRPLPKPMLFAPRTTIRIEVEEVSAGPLYAGGELSLVFHGYKLLGS
jgi:hypothetical protein